jgi:23S rRNA pseudouridine1911/1915/1917 synthase
MKTSKYLIEEDEEDIRLDVFLSNILKDSSRSYIQKIIENGGVKVNDILKKSSYKLKLNDVVTFDAPEVQKLDICAEDIPIEIIYEDSDIIVVNKASGMVVHPASGINSGTLVNALLFHCSDLSGINGVARPGIVHRIDKYTSGVLVIAKNDLAHNKLSAQLKEHTMTRMYLALVEGVIKDEEGTIDAPLARHKTERIKIAVVAGGRNAVTHYKVLERYKNTSLISCRLETGRTHQIRVHMAYIGHPVVGDPVYGYKKQRFKTNGQLLHAKKLGFIHPTTGNYIEFESEIPVEFKKIINILRNELK